jgi:DNA helicase HerA-like ATPase
VPARLRPQGFGRHTFLCGQSGSGKTYALGVLLEQLLLGTDLRMVVLDPNADYVRLGTPRPDAPADLAERLAATDVRVLAADGAGRQGSEPLRMRFMTMPVAARAALLRLDPLRDRDEYNHFLHLSDSSESAHGIEDLVRRMRDQGGTGEALAQRIENLGLLDWEVWAAERRSAWEIVETGPRMTVLDLSGFRDPHEPVAASLDLVERLWQQRETRTPTLLVIDEAHNLCPAQPAGPAQAALVERLVQVAAEGRKYGLWLLLSTQRPSKIHPQVLSQCDNLLLMRMNSPGDLAELADVFGFAPPAMLRSSPFFVQGEVLAAGTFVPAPAVLRMGARLTPEGGTDVAVPVP